MDWPEYGPLPFFRGEMYMVILQSVFYGGVFLVGFFGNIFVVLAVVSQSQLRSTTDYLISSLAMADLLIIIFCLPTTLLNNILTEWQLGALFCKLSTWINATTSCASIYTLVTVTADRYLAICHTMKYTLWEAGYTLYIIAGIWIVSGGLATPSLYGYDAIYFDYENLTLCVCASRINEKLQFVVVNLILAFIVPFLLISVSYTKIFYTVSNHRSLAVDAHARDERVKLRVATMMLTVIVVFALCWLPLYSIYTYFFFFADNTSYAFEIASQVLRPFFQWLSLLSSSLNPLIYIAYSQKYRRAFHKILLMPCRSKYQRVRGTLLRSTKTEVSEGSVLKKNSPTFRGGSRVIREASTGPDKDTAISPMITLIDSPRSERKSNSSTC
ncbi:unnamed protein product [Cylicocyclus nassatus]|uniref:G-protein coupled receptors family 1 profile domain-containing protein n=1 Tax=Cylicocyclus nassatus TaxID=53992 RepID=A0AA36H584_CYLNA|nr:unnamed protein product [Cylicocyclus nassatus]